MAELRSPGRSATGSHGFALAATLAAAVYVICFGSLCAGQLGWGAWPSMGGFYAEDYVGGARVGAMRVMVGAIQERPEAVISVPIDVVAHVARRPQVYVFPTRIGDADFALLDMQGQILVGETRAAHHRRLQGELSRARQAGLTVRDQRGPLVLLGRSRGEGQQ